MDNFLRRHDHLLEVYKQGMDWDVQREVCDRLKMSKEISQSVSEHGDEDDKGDEEVRNVILTISRRLIQITNTQPPFDPPPQLLTVRSSSAATTNSDNFSNLSWLDDIVGQLQRNKATIASLHTTELVSIFFLSNSNLKNSLLPAPERCLALLNTELPPFFVSYANSILEQLSSSHHDISSACYTVHDYVLQLEAVSTLEDVYEHIDKEAVKIRKFYDFLAKNDFINSHSTQAAHKGAYRARTVSTMLHSNFSNEDLLAQAIKQEMQTIANAMQSCREVTDGQMAKFRNMQKDRDLKAIVAVTATISEALANPTLGSSDTRPDDAAYMVGKVRKTGELIKWVGKRETISSNPHFNLYPFHTIASGRNGNT